MYQVVMQWWDEKGNSWINTDIEEKEFSTLEEAKRAAREQMLSILDEKDLWKQVVENAANDPEVNIMMANEIELTVYARVNLIAWELRP